MLLLLLVGARRPTIYGHAMGGDHATYQPSTGGDHGSGEQSEGGIVERAVSVGGDYPSGGQ